MLGFALEGDVERPGWRELFKGTPFLTLIDGHATLPLPGGRRLILTGLSTELSRGQNEKALAKVLDEAPKGDVWVVAGHSPDFVRRLRGRKVDLALAGHTHGGQVVLPFLGPPITLSRLPNRYAGGLNDYRGIPLHVSRGIGMERKTAPQVRFLCPPEICVLTLEVPAR
jgi:predicted MPP superfamily phosphohydrolase